MEHLGQFIINHWQLWAALIIILILILINELMSQKKKADELSPQSIVGKMNDDNAIIFDLRDKESYKNGHIIDSFQCIPDELTQEKLNQYKEKEIILVCARGLQSPAVASKLRTEGFQTFVLRGGIAAWQNADLPLVKGTRQ